MSATLFDSEHLQQLFYERSKTWATFVENLPEDEENTDALIEVANLEEICGSDCDENDSDNELVSMEEDGQSGSDDDSEVFRYVTSTTRIAATLLNNQSLALPEESIGANVKNNKLIDIFNQTLPIIQEHNRHLKESGFDKILNTFDSKKIEEKVGSWLNRHNTLYGGDATMVSPEKMDRKYLISTYDTNSNEQLCRRAFRNNRQKHQQHQQEDSSDSNDSLHSGETARYIRSSRSVKKASSTTTTIKTYRMVKSKREALREKYACDQDDDETHLKAIRHRRRVAANDVEYHHRKHYEHACGQKSHRRHQGYTTPSSSSKSMTQKRKVLRKRTISNSCSALDTSSDSDNCNYDKNEERIHRSKKLSSCCSQHYHTPARAHHNKHGKLTPTVQHSQRRALKMASSRFNRIYYCSHSLSKSTSSSSSSSSSSSFKSTREKRQLIKRNCRFYNDSRPCKRESECRCCNEKRLCKEYKHVADTSTEEWFVENSYSPKKPLQTPSCTPRILEKSKTMMTEYLPPSSSCKIRKEQLQTPSFIPKTCEKSKTTMAESISPPLSKIQKELFENTKKEEAIKFPGLGIVTTPKSLDSVETKEDTKKEPPVVGGDKKKALAKNSKNKKNIKVPTPKHEDTFDIELQLAIEASKKLYEQEQRTKKTEEKLKKKTEEQQQKKTEEQPKKKTEEQQKKKTEGSLIKYEKENSFKEKPEFRTPKPLKKLNRSQQHDDHDNEDMEALAPKEAKTNRKRQTAESVDSIIGNDDEIKEKIPKLNDTTGHFVMPHQVKSLASSKPVNKIVNLSSINGSEDTFLAGPQSHGICNSTAKPNDNQAYKLQLGESKSHHDKSHKKEKLHESEENGKGNMLKQYSRIILEESSDEETFVKPQLKSLAKPLKNKSLNKSKKSADKSMEKTFLVPPQNQCIRDTIAKANHSLTSKSADKSMEKIFLVSSQNQSIRDTIAKANDSLTSKRQFTNSSHYDEGAENPMKTEKVNDSMSQQTKKDVSKSNDDFTKEVSSKKQTAQSVKIKTSNSANVTSAETSMTTEKTNESMTQQTKKDISKSNNDVTKEFTIKKQTAQSSKTKTTTSSVVTSSYVASHTTGAIKKRATISSAVTSTTIRSPDTNSNTTTKTAKVDEEFYSISNDDCTLVTSTTNIETSFSKSPSPPPNKDHSTEQDRHAQISKQQLSSSLMSLQRRQDSVNTTQLQNKTLPPKQHAHPYWNYQNHTQKDILIYTPQQRSLLPAQNFSSDGCYFKITKDHLASIIGEATAEKFLKYYIGRRRFNINSTIYFKPPSTQVQATNSSDSDSDDEFSNFGQFGDLYESFDKNTD